MSLFRRPYGFLLILLALLTVPFAAVAWEAPDAEAREALPSRLPASLAAPSAAVPRTAEQTSRSPLPSRLVATGPTASPPVRTSVRVLTGRLNR